MRIFNKNEFFPLDRKAFSSSNLFGQKSVFTLNFKFIQTLIHTENTREPTINVYMVFHRCSVLFCRQLRIYWMVWYVLFTFLTTLIVYSMKKVHETYCCSSSIECQEKRTDWMHRIFIFIDKNPLFLPIISTLQVFFRVKVIKE